MIFCKSRKFIFLRVPKTASTSLSLHIINNMQFEPGDFYTGFAGNAPYGFNGLVSRLPLSNFRNDEHPHLSALSILGIRSALDIESYSVYGVLRNPVDRFFSLFTQLLDGSPTLNVKKMTKEQIAAEAFEALERAQQSKKPYTYSHPSKLGDFPMYGQADWLIHNNKPISNIIIYPHFEEFLLQLTGNDKLEHQEKIGIRPIDSPISDSTIQEIRRWYPADFGLWEDAFQSNSGDREG